ncbi:MAG: hypothetical protein HGA87_00840 [Desulfobulbaceae bacterium]|nr:hypothetical protein [Desulfobulbaceae bacterium]
MSAIEDKIAVFTPLEIYQKAEEEVKELLWEIGCSIAAIKAAGGVEQRNWDRGIGEEFADVEVSVMKSIIERNPAMLAAYEAKLHKSLYQQIPEAVQRKLTDADISRRVMENIEAGRFPGEGLMGDDDGDA